MDKFIYHKTYQTTFLNKRDEIFETGSFEYLLFTQQCIGDTDQLTEVGFEDFYFGWNGMDTMLTVKQYYSFETSNIYLYIVSYCTSIRRLVSNILSSTWLHTLDRSKLLGFWFAKRRTLLCLQLIIQINKHHQPRPAVNMRQRLLQMKCISRKRLCLYVRVFTFKIIEPINRNDHDADGDAINKWKNKPHIRFFWYENN